MHFLFRFIFCLVHLLTFHVSHQKVLDSSLLNNSDKQCSVNFGVQSDIPPSLLDAFLQSFLLDRKNVLDSENLLHGRCTDLFHCPTWRIIERYPPKWKRPVFRLLQCGSKEDDGTALYCCPEVASDASRILFPDESLAKEEGITEGVRYNTHPNRRLLPGLNQSDCQANVLPMGRILGGKIAGLGQYPWIVRLAYKSSDRGNIKYTYARRMFSRLHTSHYLHNLTTLNVQLSLSPIRKKHKKKDRFLTLETLKTMVLPKLISGAEAFS